MSMQSLLDQILRSANAGPGKTDLGKYATGAVAGGALALLLGSKRGRGLGGKALKYGSAAALGVMAWNVYRDWQAKQGGSGAVAPGAAAAPTTPTAFAQLPAPAQEDHSWTMLQAMIAAARADGHMDERERGLVEAELHRLEADPALRARVEAELRRPVDPAEVAAGADTPEKAAEVYLASVIVCDSTSTMERAYLDALATALRLPPDLKAELERRAMAGA
ncbi:MAG: tellurite resistance TerB family protein [Burkholderiaceae bacterium]|nr:tellurite resistance TerB family protein [Burkholderiaceae bacterium]